MNKHHIERIIESYQNNPNKWLVHWHWTPKDGYSFDDVRTAYNNVISEEILNRMTELYHIDEMGFAVRAAILCLIAHDNCGYMVDADPNELKILVQLGDRRAILMYWACNILKETTK